MDKYLINHKLLTYFLELQNYVTQVILN